MTMNEIFVWLSNATQINILHVVILGGGGYLIRGLIDKKHKKDLLHYQDTLSQHTEHLKYELSKSILSAELFIKTQHEVYPAVYEKIVIALGATQDIEQTGFALRGFDGFSEEEIKDMIGDLHIPDNFKADILAFVPSNYREAFKKYEEHLPLHLANQALRAVQDATNTWIMKELYFSVESNGFIRRVITNLNYVASRKKIQTNPMYNHISDDKFDDKLDEAKKIIDQLKTQMQNDMRGGITSEAKQ